MMLPLIAFLWVFVLCFGVVLQAFGADWPNRPSGLATVLDCPFSRTLCPPLTASYQEDAYLQDSTAPASAPWVFETFKPPGRTYGNGQWYAYLQDVRELYIGTWWNPSADTDGNTNGTNKLLFARHNDGGGDNSFLGWMGPAGAAKTLKWYFQTNLCNRHVRGVFHACAADGDGTGWLNPNGPSSGVVAAGSGWHRVELYLRASTGADSRDGVIRWWLDGTLVGDYTNVNYTPKGIHEFQINHTWDGFNTADRDKSKRWSYKWDHLILATGGGTGPIVPPPPATPGAILDLKVTVTP